MLVVVTAGLVLVYLVAPNLIIVPMSFSSTEFLQFPPPGLSLRWYTRFFSDPGWLEALGRSLRVGVAATALSVMLGVSAAFGLVRGRFFGRQVIQGLLAVPLIVPHIIMAAALYMVYVRVGLLNTEIGIVLAHAMLALPIVMIAVMAAMRGARRELDLAAMSLGATPREAFLRVTLPLVRPGILTGAIFAFITSFDDVILALFLGGVHVKTLPLRMWEGATQEISPVLHVVATLLMFVSVVTVIVSEALRRRARRPASGVEG